MNTAHHAGIREFRGSDLVSVRNLIHQTIDVCYSGIYPSRALQYFKDFHSDEKIMERHRNGDLLVVEQDGRLVATGASVGSDILGVFVHPGFQRQGHGAALMRELESRARAKRLHGVRTERFVAVERVL